MPTNRATNKSSPEFDELLLNAIDTVFLSLGGSTKQSIYVHLEKGFNLKRNQIPRRLRRFQEALEKIFGSGARNLEILIMKNLFLKAGVSVSLGDCDLTFIEYVKEVKRVYLEGVNSYL